MLEYWVEEASLPFNNYPILVLSHYSIIPLFHYSESA